MRRELAQTPSKRPISPNRWRGSLGKTPLPLMAMAALIPSSIRDAESFHSRNRPFLAAQRVFVRRRFASHEVFTRIRSWFRNSFCDFIALLQLYPYAKTPSAKHSPALHEGGSTFGSRDRALNWLSSSHGVRCLRAFPAAVPHLSSPNQAARNGYRTGRPCPPKGGRTFPGRSRGCAGRPAPP